MELKRLFDALTPEQRAKFGAVKDESSLNAFLKETDLTLTERQRADIGEFIKSGRLPLADEELNNVAAAGIPELPTPEAPSC